MSAGNKQTFAYVQETSNGVPPSPLDLQGLLVTNVTLDQTATKEQSSRITDNRISTRSSITGRDVAGDIETEFSYGACDELIAGAAFNDWQDNVLTFGGDIKKSFTMVRGFKDINSWQMFSGVHVNTWNISVPETGIVTTSFGLMGRSRRSSIVDPSAEITPDPLNMAYASVSVGNILIDGNTTVEKTCVTAFDFTWDNTMEVQRCLGEGLDVGAIIAKRANGTGSLTIAWSREAAQDYYERQFLNQTVSLELFIRESDESDEKSYRINIPKAEITLALPSGGIDDRLTATLEFTVVDEAPTLTRLPSTP